MSTALAQTETTGANRAGADGYFLPFDKRSSLCVPLIGMAFSVAIVVLASGCGGCADDVNDDGEWNVQENTDAGELDTQKEDVVLDSGDTGSDATEGDAGDVRDDAGVDSDTDEECAEKGEPCEHHSDCCDDEPLDCSSASDSPEEGFCTECALDSEPCEDDSDCCDDRPLWCGPSSGEDYCQVPL